MDYVINQLAIDQWELFTVEYAGSPEEDDVYEFLGVFATAAEALDESGQSIDDVSVGGISAGVNRFFGVPPFTLNASFDWPMLVLQSDGVDFPTVNRAEMLRVIRGNFIGLKVTATLTIEYDFKVGTAEGYSTETIVSPDDIGEYNFVRNAKVKCAFLNCARSGGVLGEIGLIATPLPAYGSTVVWNDLDTGLAGEESTGTFTSVQFAVQHDIVTHPTTPGEFFTDIPYWNSGSCIFRMGFYRKAPGREIGLFFKMTLDPGPGFLVVYAPTEGTDWADIYQIDKGWMPDFDVVEIDEDGPILFGVQLKVWGWRVESEGNDPQTGEGDFVYQDGPRNYAPSVVIEELV